MSVEMSAFYIWLVTFEIWNLSNRIYAFNFETFLDYLDTKLWGGKLIFNTKTDFYNKKNLFNLKLLQLYIQLKICHNIFCIKKVNKFFQIIILTLSSLSIKIKTKILYQAKILLHFLIFIYLTIVNRFENLVKDTAMRSPLNNAPK